MVFPEKIFESYFCDFADPVYPVTSLGPIDKTIYTLPLGEVRILHWHTLPMILF